MAEIQDGRQHVEVEIWPKFIEVPFFLQVFFFGRAMAGFCMISSTAGIEGDWVTTF